MPSIEGVVVMGLFVYSVVYILRYTDGPFDVLYRMRKAAGMYKDNLIGDEVEVCDTLDENAGFFTSMLCCWWCMSTWIALIGVLLCAISGLFMYFSSYVILWFASVAVSGLLHSIEEKFLDG